MWMAIAALAAAALSTYNTRKTAKKQDQAAAMAIRNQRTQQDKAHNAIARTADQLERSRANKAKAEAGKRYLAALGRAGTGGQVTGATAGGSKAYQDAMAAAAANESSYAGDLASLYAATDAPGDQRMAEAFSIGDLGTEIGTIGSIANGQGMLDELKVRGVRRNPWLDLAAQSFQGYASGGATGTTG